MSSYRRVAAIPAIAGTLLWAGASALLTEEAFRSGHWTVTTCLQPILTGSAIASAVWVHRSLADWRPIRAAGFLVLAILASVACLWGTMGRMADAQDHKQGDAMRTNRALAERTAELVKAREGQAKECKTLGPRCTAWNARIDALVVETSGMSVTSLDARADALARIATLAGYDGKQVREFAQAADPLLIPTVLEIGSILFWAAAFGRKARATQQVAGNREETVLPAVTLAAVSVYTRREALDDFLRMRRAPSQQALAARWQVSEGTVSKWVSAWAATGAVARQHAGRERAVLALPSPASLQERRAV